MYQQIQGLSTEEKGLEITAWAYRAGWRRGRQPPSLLGKQSQSGNIHFTVGQYWLMGQILSILWEILSIL
jgi:hypothetical protein